jgi:hypothetical protein
MRERKNRYEISISCKAKKKEIIAHKINDDRILMRFEFCFVFFFMNQEDKI